VSTVVGAASNPVALVMQGLNPALSLLGLNSSDPVKDQQRINRINDTYRSALLGDPTAISCLKDMASAISSGNPADVRQCAVGSEVAYAYAKKMWADFQLRTAAGAAGVTLIGASPIPTTVGNVVKSAVSNPWILGGGALLVILMLQRRGR
jgi:hypothetical protein